MAVKVGKMVQNLQRILDRIPGEMSRAVAVTAGHALGAAEELAPVHKSDLRQSGYVEMEGVKVAIGLASGGVQMQGSPPAPTGSKIVATVGFSAPYAAVQHERMDYHHSHGQAKFLEHALQEGASRLQQEMGAALQTAIRNAVR